MRPGAPSLLGSPTPRVFVECIKSVGYSTQCVCVWKSVRQVPAHLSAEHKVIRVVAG